jgi:hypothetical protein
VVNYPNDQLYTRVTEFKYLTGQEHAKTSIVFEFPKAQGDAYYPVPRKEKRRVVREVQSAGGSDAEGHFVGRLATYKYYNMDQIVAQALTTYGKIAGMKRVEAVAHAMATERQRYSPNHPVPVPKSGLDTVISREERARGSFEMDLRDRGFTVYRMVGTCSLF